MCAFQHHANVGVKSKWVIIVTRTVFYYQQSGLTLLVIEGTKKLNLKKCAWLQLLAFEKLALDFDVEKRGWIQAMTIKEN